MSNLISILVPTRNRPDNMERLVISAAGLAKDNKNLEFVFYTDLDDEVSIEKARELVFISKVRSLVGNRITLSAMWNKCFEICTGDIVMYCGDDVVFRTPDWDNIVRKYFLLHDDNIMLAHGRDGIHDGSLATHGFVHRKWVDIVGYLLPPYFGSDMADVWIDEVARLINRRVFMPELLFEHMHFSVGKATIDQTTQDRLNRGAGADFNTFLEQRKSDAKRLLSYINEYSKI
jgi:hypothetical protein